MSRGRRQFRNPIDNSVRAAARNADDPWSRSRRSGLASGFQPERTQPQVRRFLDSCTFDRLLTALLFLTIALACALTPMQGDSWWQLRAGRDMWASGRVMLSDVYSHTSYGAFWLNHEWLAEVDLLRRVSRRRSPRRHAPGRGADRRRLEPHLANDAQDRCEAGVPLDARWRSFPRACGGSRGRTPSRCSSSRRRSISCRATAIGVAAARVRDLGELPRRRAARIRAARSVPDGADDRRAAQPGRTRSRSDPHRVRRGDDRDAARPLVLDRDSAVARPDPPLPARRVAASRAVGPAHAAVLDRRPSSLPRRCVILSASSFCADVPDDTRRYTRARCMLLPLSIAARRNVGPFLMMAVPALTRCSCRDVTETRARGWRHPPLLNFAIMTTAAAIVTASRRGVGLRARDSAAALAARAGAAQSRP